MPKEMIFNCTDYETRIAVLDNGTLTDFHAERVDARSIAGNIYMGRVVRVLPGMQAAFVDIGLDRTAFLHVVDTHTPEQDFLANGDDEYADYVRELLPIEEILTEKQEILVQVSKVPIGNKGARITSHISLPGRNLVLMPTLHHIGISRRIKDEDERRRLRDTLEHIRPDEYGFIARTASEGKGEKELKADCDYLVRLWKAIQEKKLLTGVPGLVHHDLGVVLRTIRFLYTEDMERIVVDSPKEYEKILRFMNTFMPEISFSIDRYDRNEPIFDHYGIEPILEKILKKKVWLKSGGYIVIEETEALCSIDVNTGKYVGKHDLEDTILKINLEAAHEIAHQLRLRNIGGIIIIDFIDMEDLDNRDRVYHAFAEALEGDRNKTSIQKISELGLIEMTRQRRGKNLRETMCEVCPYCGGKGHVKSKMTVCHEIYRALDRETLEGFSDTLCVLAHPDVASFLREDEKQIIERLAQTRQKHIIIQSDTYCHREKFEIAPMSTASVE